MTEKEIKAILIQHIKDIDSVYNEAFARAMYSKRAFARIKTGEYALRCLPPETRKNMSFHEAMIFNTEVHRIALQIIGEKNEN